VILNIQYYSNQSIGLDKFSFILIQNYLFLPSVRVSQELLVQRLHQTRPII